MSVPLATPYANTIRKEYAILLSQLKYTRSLKSTIIYLVCMIVLTYGIDYMHMYTQNLFTTQNNQWLH